MCSLADPHGYLIAEPLACIMTMVRLLLTRPVGYFSRELVSCSRALANACDNVCCAKGISLSAPRIAPLLAVVAGSVSKINLTRSSPSASISEILVKAEQQHQPINQAHPPSTVSSMANKTKSKFSNTVFFSTAPLHSTSLPPVETLQQVGTHHQSFKRFSVRPMVGSCITLADNTVRKRRTDAGSNPQTAALTHRFRKCKTLSFQIVCDVESSIS